MPIDLPSILRELEDLPILLPRLSNEDKAELLSHLDAIFRGNDGWPEMYINRDTGKVYKPHKIEEWNFINDFSSWRHGYIKGGEGSGKSVAGIMKDLNAVRKGMVGMMASPNLPHFVRSLWKEFQRWCPWDLVIPSHRRYGNRSWSPHIPFDVHFENGAYIHCLGAKDTGSLEGPNLSWVHFDEARHFPDRSAISVIDGRVRIDGPKGEKPQIWLTSTPRMNWLFDYYGPLQCVCRDCSMQHKGEDGLEIQSGELEACRGCGSENLEIEDQYPSFKRDSNVVTLYTSDNRDNLTKDFVQSRAQSLTDAEIEVLLWAKWGDIEEGQPFLPSILWWDACKDNALPPLTQGEPMVIALDAATGRRLMSSDCFGIVGITRHPDPSRASTDVAIRYSRTWQGRPGQKIDFQGTEDNPGPERELLRLCGYRLLEDGSIARLRTGYNIVCVVYDPHELHSMSQRLTRRGVAWFDEFSQSGLRYEADRQLLNLIQHKRIVHDGDTELRLHIRNADRKLDPSGHRLRIVKRTENRRVDLAVCASMAAYRCLSLGL